MSCFAAVKAEIIIVASLALFRSKGLEALIASSGIEVHRLRTIVCSRDRCGPGYSDLYVGYSREIGARE